MLKRGLLFLAFVMALFMMNKPILHAQKVISLDSLASSLNEYTAKDAFRVANLIQYAALLDGVDANLMRTTAEEALSISQQLGDSSLVLESLFYLGLSKFNEGQLKEAYTCFQDIEAAFGPDDFERIFANAISGKAKVYNAYGRVTDALENFLDALRVFEKNGLDERIADTQHDIGAVYIKQGDFNEALMYYSSAIERYGKSGNLRKMAFICVDKADLVRDLGRFDEAIMGYQDALGVFEKYGYSGGAALAYLNMGKLYLDNKELGKSEESLMKADSFNIKDGNAATRLSIDLAFGDLFLAKNNMNKAKLFYEKAYKTAAEIELLDNVLLALSGLKNIAKSEKNYLQSLSYSEEIIQLTDSLNTINQRSDLNAVKANHELEISENQNMILQKEKDLQLAASAKQQTIILSVVIVLILLSIFSLYVVSAYRNQKILGEKLTELNGKIASQNERLESANKEISNMNEKLERRVEERTQSLIDKNRQLERYAFKHSHELRAPLSRLMGLVELVKLDAFESQEDLKLMVQGLDLSAVELDQIIRQMAEDLENRDLFVQEL